MSKRPEDCCNDCGGNKVHRPNCRSLKRHDPLDTEGDTERDRPPKGGVAPHLLAQFDVLFDREGHSKRERWRREAELAEKQRRLDQGQAMITNLIDLARSGSDLISPEAGRRLLRGHADWERSGSPEAKVAYRETLAYAAESLEIRRRMAERIADQHLNEGTYLLNLARSNSKLIPREIGRRLLRAHADWERSGLLEVKLAYGAALADAARCAQSYRMTAKHLAPKAEPEHQTAFRATKLTWRLLSPGRRITEHLAGQQAAQVHQGKAWDRNRLALLDSLKPLNWYEGAHLGQTVYFVAVFAHVAIADSPEWGNALYYCTSDQGRWQNVFRLEKQAAVLAGARRIVHVDGWEARVRGLVKQDKPVTGTSSYR